jgi:hypothetical protein
MFVPEIGQNFRKNSQKSAVPISFDAVHDIEQLVGMFASWNSRDAK